MLIRKHIFPHNKKNSCYTLCYKLISFINRYQINYQFNIPTSEEINDTNKKKTYHKNMIIRNNRVILEVR